jgi:hypothetical protein
MSRDISGILALIVLAALVILLYIKITGVLFLNAIQLL